MFTIPLARSFLLRGLCAAINEPVKLSLNCYHEKNVLGEQLCTLVMEG